MTKSITKYNKSLTINELYDELMGRLIQKVISYLREKNSISCAILQTSRDTGIPLNNLKHLLFSIYRCGSNRQLKKKLKEKESYPKATSESSISRKRLKRKILNKIIMYFRKGYSARDITKHAGMSYAELKDILEMAKHRRLIPESNIPELKRLYFNKKIIYKLVAFLNKGYADEQIAMELNIKLRHLRKYIKRAKSIIAEEKRTAEIKNKLIGIRKLYLESGSLGKVAEKMNITRERVRQLLKKGEDYNLFKYEKYSQKKLKDLASKFTRLDLINAIKSCIWSAKICNELGISEPDFRKLLKHYNIDFAEYRKSASMGRYLQQYSKIVDFLGYHPSATEMNSKSDWRTIWFGISRLWGSLDNFRKEFGIQKPKMKIHPNTLKHWKLFIEKKKMIKDQKKKNVHQIIEEHGPVKLMDICTKLSLKRGAISTYINELLDEKKIHKVGKGNATKYVPIPI